MFSDKSVRIAKLHRSFSTWSPGRLFTPPVDFGDWTNNAYGVYDEIIIFENPIDVLNISYLSVFVNPERPWSNLNVPGRTKPNG